MRNETDRELIEFAAKAAGLSECGWMADTFTHVVDNRFVFWEPLTDDGDALRLAVDLDFDIELTEDAAWAGGINSQNHQLYEWHRNGKYAATRRAIVRAAAEIGKAMP